MSAIGDYIHRTALGYRQHGISKKGDFLDCNYGKQRKRIYNKLKNFNKMKEKDKLEKSLQKILSTKNKSENSNIALIQKVVYNKLSEDFNSALGKINWETGDIEKGLKQVEDAKEATSSKIRESENQNRFYIRTIEKRIQALEIQVNNLRKDGKEKDANTLQSKIEDIYNSLNEILKGFNIIEGKRGYKTLLKNQDEGLAKISIENNENVSNLVTTINQLIKDYSSQPAINLQKGDLFEYVIALAPYVSENMAKKELRDILDLKVLGKDRSKVKINFEKNFSKTINFNSLSFKGYSSDKYNKTMISYGASQDKVDVILDWEGYPYPISAKNVNLSYPDIHILSGSSLLYLIQDENANFINHWLNIIVTHEDEQNMPNKNLSAIHNTMHLTLLYKALTGDTYGRNNPATVFIVNDNHSDKVYIIDMMDLIEKASKNLEGTSSVFISKDGGGNTPINKLRIQQRYDAADASERITDIISQLHQQKIAASLKSSLIKSFS